MYILTTNIFTVHTKGVAWALAGAANACSSIVTVVLAAGLQSFIYKHSVCTGSLREVHIVYVCTFQH